MPAYTHIIYLGKHTEMQNKGPYIDIRLNLRHNLIVSKCIMNKHTQWCS